MAELIGSQASATFAGSDLGTIGTTLYGFVTRETNSKEMVNVTRWGDVHARKVGGISDASVTLAFTMDAAYVPIIPNGTAAILVVYTNTGTHQTTYTNALVASVERSSDARQGVQTLTVRFDITAATAAMQPAFGA